MSDNTKLKKLARARQAKTGESYTTALMHVRSGPSPDTSLEHRIRVILPMIAARDAEERQIAVKYGVTERLVVGTPEGDAYLEAPRPKLVELTAALRSLNFELLLKTLAVFYTGQGTYSKVRATFDFITPLFRQSDHVVEQLVQKRDLKSLLEKGLEVARTAGEDLNEPWPAGEPEDGAGVWDFRTDGHLIAALEAVGEWRRRPWISREEHDPVALRRAWARREGVKESSGHRCLTRLAHGRCDLFNCESLPGSDHTSVWNRDGKPYIYVTQPYHLPDDVLVAMLKVCDRLGLRLRVDSAPAWHDPGAILVEVMRRDGRK